VAAGAVRYRREGQYRQVFPERTPPFVSAEHRPTGAGRGEPGKSWGIGLAADDPQAMHPEQWRGLNLLGFALMDVRNALLTAIARDQQ